MKNEDQTLKKDNGTDSGTLSGWVYPIFHNVLMELFLPSIDKGYLLAVGHSPDGIPNCGYDKQDVA